MDPETHRDETEDLGFPTDLDPDRDDDDGEFERREAYLERLRADIDLDD